MTPAPGPVLAGLAAAALVAAVHAAAGRGVRGIAATSRGRVAGAFARLPGWGRLAVRVRDAGLGVGPVGFVLATAASALAAGGLLALAVRRPLLVPAGAVVAVMAARAVLRSADGRRRRAVASQLPGVASHMASALGAGLSLRQALSRAARDAPEPVAGELRQVATALDLGARVDEALDALAARLPDPDLQVLVTAILVQRRAGGDLARALGELATRLEERGRLARELAGATAQARATAWLVAGLPLAGGVLVELASPGTIAGTLGRGPGLVILVASAALQGVGILLIRRIARVEP